MTSLRTSPVAAAALALSLLASAATARAASSEPPADLFASIRAVRAERQASLAQAPPGSIQEAALALQTGNFRRAWQTLRGLIASDSTNFDAIVLQAKLDLAMYRFDDFRADLARVERLKPDHLETHRLEFRCEVLRDDLGSVEKGYQAQLAADTTDAVALYFAARFEHLTLNFDRAIAAYQRALRHAVSGTDSVRAIEGLGACWLQKGDKNAALRYESSALQLRYADDGLLTLLDDVLNKLGRGPEGTEGLRLALELNPYNENAHYLLGNGFARYNYSELREHCTSALADSAQTARLAAADLARDPGRREEARGIVDALCFDSPGLAQARVQLGSYSYEEGKADDALGDFQAALALCPDYGRAHNGIARSLELYRRRIDIHHEQYEKEFAEAAWPEIPGIEKFVVNYASLTPRIQKRVALSIEPWKAFVPVLIEGGATFYIKHLHEVLSHTPFAETLKDQRISYDLRLWDDVRGCGGHHTVTGIEDVEGTLLGRYNTVVHELTHQVHGVLTADLDREIQDLYRRARARMDSGQEAFVSLYQASSVFEYLAEGVNSLFTPRRDRFDTRDILRERLEARDPALVEELHKLLAIADVTPFYPVAYTTMGDDELENGRIEKAVAAYRKAYDRSPDSEEGASKLSYALCVQGNPAEASRISTDAVARHPASADLQLGLAQAEYVRTGDREAYVKLLRTAMDRVDLRERYRVALDLGRARLDQDAVDEARSFSDSVLAYQSDNPEGLQLRGDVEAAAGRLDSARVYFNRDIAVRAGTLGIRIAYAQALLMASGVDSARIEEAARQVDAARLADPEDPHVEMMDGWLALDRGHAAEAITKLNHALSHADWLDLARVELARAELVSGDPGAARKILEPLQTRFTGPEQLRYVYNSRQSGYELVGEAGYTERHELARALEAAGGR